MADNIALYQFAETFARDSKAFEAMDDQPLIFRETEPARPYLVLAAFEDSVNHVGCTYRWWVLGVMEKVRDMTPGGGMDYILWGLIQWGKDSTLGTFSLRALGRLECTIIREPEKLRSLALPEGWAYWCPSQDVARLLQQTP